MSTHIDETGSSLRRLGLGVLFAAGVVFASCAQAAADTNLLEQRGYLAIGTFVNASRLKIRVDGEAGEIGTPIDWSRTFGDQDRSRLRVDGLWRLRDRHHLRFLYTDYSQTTRRQIDEEIIWEGDVIPVNASATATFGFEVLELAYEYAFVKRPDLEVAGTFGLHYTQLEAILTAEVKAGDGEVSGEVGGKADVDAPLPVVGARSLWRLNDKLYLDGLAQAFYLTFGDYEGSILNWRMALLWQPMPRVGFGAGYDWFRVNVDGEDPDFRGTLRWTYSGPQVFVSFSF